MWNDVLIPVVVTATVAVGGIALVTDILEGETETTAHYEEHTKGARPSTKGKHEKGEARRRQRINDKKRKKPDWQDNPNKGGRKKPKGGKGKGKKGGSAVSTLQESETASTSTSGPGVLPVDTTPNL